MPHDRGPLEAKMAGYAYDVGKERIQRIVLIFAPPRVPEATVIKNDDLTVLSHSGGNPDPIVGVEIVASMQDYDGRFAARAAFRPEGTIKYRNISRLKFSCSMQRLIHGRCPFCSSATRWDLQFDLCGSTVSLGSCTTSGLRIAYDCGPMSCCDTAVADNPKLRAAQAILFCSEGWRNVPFETHDNCALFCRAARAEEAIIRAWQTEIVAQRLALIVAPEQTAPLQFRHYLRAEVIEAAGQIGELHGEAVGGFGHKPFLHLIGDCLRSAYHG